MQRLMRSSLWLLIMIFSGLLLCDCAIKTQETDHPPNFILIMADDLGYAGIGCFGNDTIRTPQLDRLARQGVRLTDYHSNGSVCSPTRAAMLSGMYQQRTGLEGVIYARGPTRQTGLDTSTHTLAKALRQHGYATGITGKWHLGYQPEFNPVYQGFDQFRGYVSGNVDYHTHYDNTGVFDWWNNLDTIRESGYVTDLITDHAVDFIHQHKEDPFFLYVAHEAPHVPFQGRNDPGYRYPDSTFTYFGPVEDRDRAYIDMVEAMDEGIGRIMATLVDLSLDRNTVVIFVSDNGAETFGHNGALRGSKGSLFEGGHRVPGIVSWPGTIKPGIINATLMSFDWYPTLLSWSGAKQLPPNLDGMDLSDLLLNGEPLPERPLFWRYRNQAAMRQGPHKLMITETDTLLFDLTQDLAESRNISQENPGTLNQLLLLWNRWSENVGSIPQKTQ